MAELIVAMTLSNDVLVVKSWDICKRHFDTSHILKAESSINPSRTAARQKSFGEMKHGVSAKVNVLDLPIFFY